MEEKTVGLLLVILVVAGFVAYRAMMAPSPEEEISGVWKYKEGTEEPEEPHASSLLQIVIMGVKKI